MVGASSYLQGVSKLTIDQVASIVDSEGLGYAVQCHTSADRIADPQLAKLWREAKVALTALNNFLEQHAAAEEEATPSKLTGQVSVSHEQILCDEPPAMFDGAPDDEYGCAQLTSVSGGTLRLNLNGGRFGSDPEVYVEGAFDAAELTGWLCELAPCVAGHISQTVRIKDATGELRYVRFRNGAVEL